MDAGLRTVLYGADFKAHPNLEGLNLSPGPGLIEMAPRVFNPEYLKVSCTFQSNSGAYSKGIENRNRRSGNVANCISMSPTR